MMAQARTSKGRHERSSTLSEMFKLAGDMMGDVMGDVGRNMMTRNTHEDEASLDTSSYTKRRWEDDDDDASSVENGGVRGLRAEFRSQSYHDDDYSYTTTVSEELRQDRVRQIRQREMDNYRRQRELGDERELELKQKLSQFEEEFLGSPSNQDADPDFVFHGPSTPVVKPAKSALSSPAKEKTTLADNKKTKNIFELVQERAMLALSGDEDEPEEAETLLSEEVQTTFTSEGQTTFTEDNDSDDDDDLADQIVHEMMQLLHHSRKNRHEADRLIGYKRTFIRERHETNTELDAHILKNANYKKLECSTRRFVRHIEDGDVPRTEQTLAMERELQANVSAMRDIRRESDELDMEFESMFDAAE